MIYTRNNSVVNYPSPVTTYCQSEFVDNCKMKCNLIILGITDSLGNRNYLNK